MMRPRSDYEASSIDHLRDEEILDLVIHARERFPEPIVDDDHVIRIAHDIVAKVVDSEEQSSEALALDLVFHHTEIPVPRVRRIIKESPAPGLELTHICMDYIPGRQLSVVWPKMTLEEQLCVVFTLREYVRQLQAIRHPRSAVPGPIAPGSQARQCVSPVFGPAIDRRGPFASYGELSAWFDKAQRLTLEIKEAQPGWEHIHFEPFDTVAASSALTLCHQDLNMRNIIVGDDGRLWLVDWAWAGFYPPWFEYLAMKVQTAHEERLMNRKEPFWTLMVPFICRPYYREER